MKEIGNRQQPPGRLWRWLAPATTTLLLAASVSAADGIRGEAAPEWDVTTWYNLPEGKETLGLADLKGKVVYLFCFQAWCPGCQSHGFPTMKKVYERFQDDPGVAFVAVQTVFEGFSVNTSARADKTVESSACPCRSAMHRPRAKTRLP